MEQGHLPRTADSSWLGALAGVWERATAGSFFGTGPLIATFATLLLYDPWVVPRECLSLGGTNE